MRGGKREGAGRPKTGTRPQHQCRAFPEEWEVIRKVMKLTRNGHTEELHKIINDYQERVKLQE